MDAFTAMGLGSSERDRALVVATLRIGNETASRPSGRYSGLMRTNWQKIAKAGVPATFEGFASTLREKRRKFRDPLSNFWRHQMAWAFSVTLRPDGLAVKQDVFSIAASVGEEAFARSVLWRMIDAAADAEV